jgi:hypothetical protein
MDRRKGDAKRRLRSEPQASEVHQVERVRPDDL